LNNDSSSAEDRCSVKLPSNDSKCFVSVDFNSNIDFNSNALVEPNRETSTNSGRDIAKPASSTVNLLTSGVSQAAAAGTDTELTSVAHMLDAASANNFRTLLKPSLTPPKTVSAIVTTIDNKTAMSDDAAATDDAQSTAETVVKDIIQRNKVIASKFESLLLCLFAFYVYCGMLILLVWVSTSWYLQELNGE